MPFKSKAQQRWMYAAEARGEVPAGTAKHWSDETKKRKGGFKALPERVAAAGDGPISEKSGAVYNTATGAQREPDGSPTVATRELHGMATVATRRQLHLPDGSVLDLLNPGQYKSAMNTPNPNADMLQQLRAYMRVPPPMAGASLGGQQTTPMAGLPGQNALNVIDMQGGLDATGQTVDGNHGAGIAKGFKMAGLVRNYQIEDTVLFGRLKTAGLFSGLFGKGVAGAAKAAKPLRGQQSLPFTKTTAGNPYTKSRVGDALWSTPIRQALTMTGAAAIPAAAAGTGIALSKPQQTQTPATAKAVTPVPAGKPAVSAPELAQPLPKPPTGPVQQRQGPGVTPAPVESPPSLTPDPIGNGTSAPTGELAKPNGPPDPNGKPADWMAQIQQFLKNPNHQGALLGMGAAGLGDYLMSSKDDREERSGFSQILPWLLGGGAGYYFGPELMKMLAGAGKTAPAAPGAPAAPAAA